MNPKDRKRSHPQSPLYFPGLVQASSIPPSTLRSLEGDLSIAWTQLTGLPTTLAGYGITDAYTDAEVDALLAGKSDVGHTHAFADLTAKPTTLAGYGITDAASDAELAALLLNDLADVVIASVADGHVLTWDSGTSKWVNEAPAGGGAVSSVFGRTGAVVAASNDYTFAQLASKPTTLAGYGITDAVDGTGTGTKLPKWSDSNTLTDSLLTEATDSLTMEGATAASLTLKTSTGATSDVSQLLLKRGANLKWRFGNNIDSANIDNFTIYNDNLGTFPLTITLADNTIKLAGLLKWSADNTYDIGAAGATRPRDFFLGRNALIAGTLGVTGVATFLAQPIFNASTPAVRFTNSAGTGSVACVFTASKGPTGAQTAIQGWLPVSIGGTTRYMPFW